MDARSLKTRASIEQNFVLLLATKPVSEITVTELTQKADLNRRTFYSHYQDIADLQKKTEEHALIDFSKMVDNYNGDADNVAYFNHVLKYIFDNMQTLGILCRNRDSTLMSNLLRVTIAHGTAILPFANPTDGEYILNYVCWGLVGIFHKLIRSGTGFTDENTKMLTELISSSITPYLKAE